MADQENKDFQTLITGQKKLLEEQKKTTIASLSGDEKAAYNAEQEEQAVKRSEAAREREAQKAAAAAETSEGEDKKQGGWLRTLGEKFVPAFLKSTKSGGAAEEEKKDKEGAFRKRFVNWMKDSRGWLKDMAKGAFTAIKAKLPSLKSLLMTGGMAALLFFLKSPYFEKTKVFIEKEILPILAKLYDNVIKPLGIYLGGKFLTFFKSVGEFIKNPSWTTAGDLITDNKGLLATLTGYLALKTFGVKGVLTGVKSVSGLLTKGWGPKAVTAATTAMKGLTLGKGLAMGGLVAAVGMGINDAIMAVAKADDWKVSKTSAGIGGFLGGTGSGWGGAMKNAGKWAMAGASAGFLIGGPVGALIGGLGGGVIGAILGFFGGKKIAVALDAMGTWFKEKWDAIVEVFKAPVTAVADWIKLLFKDPVAALKKLWTTLTEGYASLMDIFWSPVQKGITWIMKLFGWDDAAAAVEKFSIKGFVMGVFAKIKTWITGLFAWGKKAGTTEAGDWSLRKMVGEVVIKVKDWFIGLFTWAKKTGTDKEGEFSLALLISNSIKKIWEWFKGLLDIDVMSIAKSIPGASTLLGWMSDKSLTEEGKASIKKHGQTLEGAKESGLYDADFLGDSEINKKGLREGVKSGLVQKEMLQAILADKDLSTEDTKFMKRLVEQATKKGSLFTADHGLYNRLDKIFPSADIERKRLEIKGLESRGGASNITAVDNKQITDARRSVNVTHVQTSLVNTSSAAKAAWTQAA